MYFKKKDEKPKWEEVKESKDMRKKERSVKDRGG